MKATVCDDVLLSSILGYSCYNVENYFKQNKTGEAITFSRNIVQINRKTMFYAFLTSPSKDNYSGLDSFYVKKHVWLIATLY